MQAEVQSLFHDGSIALQTRSEKYGKVSPVCSSAMRCMRCCSLLIIYLQQQLVSLHMSTGMELILGLPDYS